MQEEFNNISEEKEINDVIEKSEDCFDSVDAEKIKIVLPDKKTDNKTGKGLKIFCLAVAFTIILTCFSFGGYFLGKNQLSKPQNNNSINVTLEKKPEADSAVSTAQIYASVAQNVVGILVYNSNGKMSEASGVVYTSDGYIVTNDHIYSDVPSAKFKIFMHDNNIYDAYYVAGDTRSDLAVLKISQNVKLSAAVFGDSSEVVSGEKVCAIGYPNGYNSRSTITTGVVSAPKVRATISSSYSSNFIQTDTAINPGNSGGALINEFGQIIGITSSKISGAAYEGVGFAIPSKTVKKIAESLIQNGSVKDRARLGISYNFYNPVMAELAQMPASGLLVREVSEDSDLNGKLFDGDLITRVNDVAITDDSIILDLLEDSKPGDRILLTVIGSKGNHLTISVELLSDEGSSSYVDDSTPGKQPGGNGEFNWPEGF